MSEKEILVKLKALKEHIEYALTHRKQVTIQDCENYISSFERFWTQLKELNLDLYGDFNPNDYYSYNSSDFKAYIPPFYLKPILNNIQYLIKVSPDDELVKTSDFKITKEGIFFTGQYFDALIRVSEILKSATKEIILIDGYISDRFLDIFATINKDVSVKILTKAKSINPTVTLKESAFNKQYNPTNITLEIKSNEDFHDRFLIIDRQDFYHFGASLKDLGNKGFMFSKIEESVVQKVLLTQFTSKW